MHVAIPTSGSRKTPAPSGDTSDDWYYNQDSKTPKWSPLNIDIPGWNHGETVQSSGPDGIITYYPPDCHTAQYYANEAVYSTFCPQGQENSGTGGDNIVGDRTYSNSVGGASSNGGENGDNRLSKLPAAVGMVTDVTNTIGATVKCVTPLAETALRTTLTRPTTVVGAIIGGASAGYHMYQVGYNNRDMISIGLGIVGVGLECVDAGLVIDLISVGVSAAGVYMDVTNPDFNK